MTVTTVAQSAEHSFLTALERIRTSPSGWVALRIALSRKIRHDDMIDNPDGIAARIEGVLERGTMLANTIKMRLEEKSMAGTIYHFHDGDVITMVQLETNDDRAVLKALYDGLGKELGPRLCEYHNMNRDIYLYQKLSDRKLVSSKLITAYRDMSDLHKVESLPLRRQRREDPLVLFVEDDRFTANYAANILNKEFDVINAKTGEEAISAYIEHAPDMTFLDIHLPGITGHDTLRALRRIDPESYIVMLSVDAVSKNIKNASTNGASDFLKKPFSKDRLLYKAQRSPFIKADLTQFVSEEKRW